MLRRGSTGEDVRRLQQRLNEFGNYGLVLDGIYGPLTEAAVRDFQAKTGIAADGIAGHITLTRMGLNLTQTPSSGNTTFVFGSNQNQNTDIPFIGTNTTQTPQTSGKSMNTISKIILGTGAVLGIGYALSSQSKPARKSTSRKRRATAKRKKTKRTLAPKRPKPAKKKVSKLTVSRPSANTVIVRKNQMI